MKTLLVTLCMALFSTMAFAELKAPGTVVFSACSNKQDVDVTTLYKAYNVTRVCLGRLVPYPGQNTTVQVVSVEFELYGKKLSELAYISGKKSQTRTSTGEVWTVYGLYNPSNLNKTSDMLEVVSSGKTTALRGITPNGLQFSAIEFEYVVNTL